MAGISGLLGATWGKIAHVDLTKRTIETETPDPEVLRLLAGGRGLAAYLLLRDLPAGVDALSPENLLIFAPGVLQGTNLPGTGRHGVAAKSPLTGAIGSSEAGGWFGNELKTAGFDALVVHGRADEPVYLWVKDGTIEIRSAKHLWGLETGEVQSLLREDLGDSRVRIAQIGAAGENMVRFAAIMSDVNRAAGRNGLGAVMGSKNLKAVAVRGSRGPKVADRAALVAMSKWLGENYKAELGWAVRMGTVGGIRNLGNAGALPTRAFIDPMFEDRMKISGQLMYETILKGRDTCHVCPVKCKQVVGYEDPEGKYNIDTVYGGPEYESLAALGSNCCVNNLLAVAKANERCAAYSIDTMSAGGVIAFVMDCFERGLLTPEMTGGYVCRWGDGDAMLEGIEMIAHRRGFGAQMAEGVARLAAWIGQGAEDIALHVKGQELPMHEPRLKKGIGVGYAIAPMGADHMTSMDDTSYTVPESNLLRVAAVYKSEPLPPMDLSEEKMNVFYYESNFAHFEDSAVLCQFYPYNYEQTAEIMSAATGVEYDARDVLAVGERAQTLSRLFNYREGFTAADDRLPRRVMKAFEEGPLAGSEITPEQLTWAIHRFYELMGWDPQSGAPQAERIRNLGLAPLLGS